MVLILMYQEYADFALKVLKKEKVDYGEVRLEETEGDGLVLKNGTPEVSGFDNSFGMGIRFLIKNSMGFVSINDFENKKISQSILEAVRRVKRGYKMSASVKLSDEEINKKNYKVHQKIKLKDVDPGKKIKFLYDIDSGIKQAVGRYMALSSEITKKYIITTEGTKIISEIPRNHFSYFLTVKSNGKSAQKYWQACNAGGYEVVNKWNLPELMIKEYKSMDLNLRKAQRPPKGKIDLVVGPEVTGIMVHESVGHPFEADRIFGREAAQAGESFVNQKMIGEQIGSDKVTVVDDPTIETSAGYYLYDDEGVKARRRFLIKDGKINEFLHNRETAVEMGLNSNGAARSESFDKEAIVRMANTFLLPGKFSEHELIKDIKLGVYMRDFTEWNIDDKRYQMKYVGSDCYLIKNGKISHPVLKPIIEITTPSLWKSVDAVGKNLDYHTGTCGKGEPMQGVPAWLGGPSMRIRNVRLG